MSTKKFGVEEPKTSNDSGNDEQSNLYQEEPDLKDKEESAKYKSLIIGCQISLPAEVTLWAGSSATWAS